MEIVSLRGKFTGCNLHDYVLFCDLQDLRGKTTKVTLIENLEIRKTLNSKSIITCVNEQIKYVCLIFLLSRTSILIDPIQSCQISIETFFYKSNHCHIQNRHGKYHDIYCDIYINIQYLIILILRSYCAYPKEICVVFYKYKTV